MVDQTTIANGRNAAPAKAMTRNVSDLAGDITALAELQTRLFMVDAQESVRRLVVPLILGALGLVLILGSIPVLLAAVADLLVDAGMDETAATFVAFAIGLVLGALALLAAWLLLRGSFATFNRSREEFARNLQWIKDALKQTGPTPQPVEDGSTL